MHLWTWLRKRALSVYSWRKTVRRLELRGWEMGQLRMRQVLIGATIATITGTCYSYETILISTGAPSGFEQSFIQDISSRYNARVQPNPLASNVYSIVLYGPNAGYNPPASNADLLNALIQVSTSTYPYGWADGESYQQFQDYSLGINLSAQCNNPSVFVDTMTPSFEWDQQTCQNAVVGMATAIYDLHLSTPIAIPDGF